MNDDIGAEKVVTFGLSEITILLTLIGSALTALFGRDWGVSAHIPQIAGWAVIILPAALAIARSIKHVGAAQANAKVAVAQQVVTGYIPSSAVLSGPPATSDL